MRLIRALFVALALALPSAVSAEERISHFWSDVEIRKDSSVEVTETIDVVAEHDRINHGIYRDFPTRYRGPHGSQIRVGFTFQGATLDGLPVKAATEPVSNGVRIKVGDPEKYVDVGEHRYVLHYRATREIGFFKDFDEIYWNVTGNGWIFPIDVAEAHIRLPEAVRFGQRATYTGPQGSTSTNAEIVDEKPGEISFRTTAPLAPYEGLTVAVAFPKGVVTQPGQSAYWLSDYGPPAVGAAALGGLCVFFFLAWQRVGRDPRPGTIVPIFSPPDDLTPAGMRYVTKMNSDSRAFAAALVDMGVRGHIRLTEEEGGWFARDKTRLERLAGPAPLPPEEEAALRELVQTGESIMMEQKNHAKFSAAKSGLAEVLKEKYEGRMFKRNYGWAAAGTLLFIAALWVAAAAVVLATDTAEIWRIGVVLGGLIAAALLWQGAPDTTVGKCLVTLVGFVAVAIAFVLGMPIIGAAFASGWWLPLLLPALALPLVISCFWWIAAPTKEGRVTLDHIAGFKQYLSITERERLDRMTPPQETPELFEKYLPFAIALGVENRWAERFAGVLAAAAAQGRQGFAWYAGSSNPWDNPTGFVDSVGSSLASTISSASTAPGSSSGSGGGGGPGQRCRARQ